jgi:rare lipoprotein A
VPSPRRFPATPGRLIALAAAVAVAAPGAAWAQSDGTGGVSPTQTTPVQTVPTVQGDALLPAPVDLGGRIGALLGMDVTVAGTLPGAAGRVVAVQRQDPAGGWVTVATTTAGPDGSYRVTWKVDRVGLFATRAILAPTGDVQAASLQAPTTPITVYRAAKATWFGPGLYGNRTACGQRLTRRLRGIAHRSLPCGTVVELVYDGKVVRAPVVDRGPFRRGIRYDLTAATAKDLGFEQTDVVGAAQVAAAPKRRAAAQPSR